MADVRFEISVNGVPVCTAGVTGFGAVTTFIGRIRRDPARFEAEERGRPGFSTLEDWSREELYASVNGSDWSREGYTARWLDRELEIGDEITVRVLGPGPITAPVRTDPPGIEWR